MTRQGYPYAPLSTDRSTAIPSPAVPPAAISSTAARHAAVRPPAVRPPAVHRSAVPLPAVHPVHTVHSVHLLALLLLILVAAGCSNNPSKERASEERSAVEETTAHGDIALSSDIVNETILTADIATGPVTTDEILNETIVSEDLAVGSVNSRVIESESFVAVDLADGAISNRRLDPSRAFHSSPVDRLNRKDLLTHSTFATVNTTLAAEVLTGEVLPVLHNQDTTPLQQPVLALPVPPLPENNFRSATTSPFSTFSIDVDGASYSNVRGFINRAQAPPPAMVRIEELVNYFSYDYPEPTDHHPFAFATEVAPCPWNPDNRLVRVALQGKRMDEQELPPANLVFLIDVSGSMNNELPLLKQAFGKLIDRLRPEDRVAIVVYAGAAGLVLESTSGRDQESIRKSLNGLAAGGSTAGGAGIQLAYDVAAKHFIEGGNNRVILATDGDFNVGVSDQEGLVKLIEEKREAGIFLSLLGFGHGNYQDAKMEQLADNGNGVYYYIDRLEEAEKVFGSGLTGTLLTIAKDVKLQIRFNPEHVAAYRLIGYENRTMAARDFANDRKDAGELGAGHSVTAFYEVIPVGVDPTVEIDTSASTDYLLEDAPPELFTSNDILLARLRYKLPEDTTSSLIEHLIRDEPKELEATDEDFRFATAVAAWGMLLRGSAYAGSATSRQILQLARKSVGSDPEGLRSEFIDLVRMWRTYIEEVAAK